MSRAITCLLLLNLLMLAACASKTDIPPANDPATYFQEGEQYFAEGDYKKAIDSWEKVRDSYYSPELNALAEFKIAEAHFLAEEYVEAAVAYEAFLKNHPDSPRTPDVLYQLGLCYNYQILASDQDQTATIYALNAFRTLKERFPEDRRKQEVQLYIDRCLNQLAASELNIGRFYLRTESYAAAINRLYGLLNKYPNYYQRDRAYYYLGQAYLLNGERDKAKEAFNTLFTDYVGSEYIVDAQEFIEKND
jgi:outer membrane protein assembly factor BamD